MVKFEDIKNKEGEVLKTKEGETLKRVTFEVGDVFIPSSNRLIVKEHPFVDQKTGEKKTARNSILRCKVQGYPKDGEEEELYVNLTPSQANTIQKKIESEVLINQELFNAYEYLDKDGNPRVGVGFKAKSIPAKSFSDFESKEEEE